VNGNIVNQILYSADGWNLSCINLCYAKSNAAFWLSVGTGNKQHSPALTLIHPIRIRRQLIEGIGDRLRV